jgi:multidrug efflux pump subunit AcrA (membrane-fusion protein)
MATATTVRQLRLAEATVRDLEQTETVDGVLGFEAGSPILSRIGGTLTSVEVDDDATAVEGEILFTVNDEPVVLLYGDLPAWRPMRRGIVGADVLQLETALVGLGYDPDGDVTVDEEFTWYTRVMVEDWQEAIGATVDGVVDLGEVVFLPGPVRIADALVDVGTPIRDGTAILATSSDDVKVTVTLGGDDEGLFEEGDRVTVALPDATDVAGTVESLDTTLGQNGQSATLVTIALDDPAKAARFGDATVEVTIVTDAAYGVLTVPVTALVALAEGGYAVEVEAGDGTRLVAVDPGMYADGFVEIASGDLSAGDRVVVP